MAHEDSLEGKNKIYIIRKELFSSPMSAKLEQEDTSYQMNEQASKVARIGVCAMLTLYSSLLLARWHQR